jgi:hypothetical protein
MALYLVERTDLAASGEFISAVVRAGGVAQARKRFAEYPGVAAGGKNLHAVKVDPTGDPSVFSVEFEPEDLPETAW